MVKRTLYLKSELDRTPKKARPKRCMWMLAEKAYHDCGKPATHVLPKLWMYFCDDCAKLASMIRPGIIKIDV